MNEYIYIYIIGYSSTLELDYLHAYLFEYFSLLECNEIAFLIDFKRLYTIFSLLYNGIRVFPGGKERPVA